MRTTTAAGPRPQTLEPSVLLVIVDACTIGPTPQIQPFIGLLGEKNALIVVGAMPNGGTLAPGWWDGLQTSGTMVRVVRFSPGSGIHSDAECLAPAEPDRQAAWHGVAVENLAIKLQCPDPALAEARTLRFPVELQHVLARRDRATLFGARKG